ncbi:MULTISPECIES: molybdopterin converting factor subunit 1 [Bacillaceae]|uniref:molybdopterin converting factor subunit 1 n=1 Tax=Bacillaceae TaxID=186817 RepID=UPI000C78D059|nr:MULTISPECIES: molybdopterin converting factor subunit 1 [Bacillaceae]PLR68658.1 molybdopterin converting factor subunit 1 [Bacillus sp. UMB0893]QNG58566.1 molybdopterin converting factor subunit 1 [Bacillus sp. PAMC26568]
MIKVLLFAHLQDEAGLEKLEIDRTDITVLELKQWMQDKHQLSSLTGVMTAINESFANDSDKIVDGDTVAFIPPVSGG